uniref:Guanylate cyclase domain-containing protein n=1 Tax=Rodentolepis nana TaxID=102285 RepID=A0A0R3TY41_RODNA
LIGQGEQFVSETSRINGFPVTTVVIASCLRESIREATSKGGITDNCTRLDTQRVSVRLDGASVLLPLYTRQIEPFERQEKTLTPGEGKWANIS